MCPRYWHSNSNELKTTFDTANYNIKNRGKTPLNIIQSYLVLNKGDINLVKNITKKDISKDNNLKITINLKNISTNTNIMSVVDNSIGSEFTVEPESNTKLRFEPTYNDMADAEKEQLSDTKTTLGKIIFTISN